MTACYLSRKIEPDLWTMKKCGFFCGQFHWKMTQYTPKRFHIYQIQTEFFSLPHRHVHKNKWSQIENFHLKHVHSSTIEFGSNMHVILSMKEALDLTFSSYFRFLNSRSFRCFHFFSNIHYHMCNKRCEKIPKKKYFHCTRRHTKKKTVASIEFRLNHVPIWLYSVRLWDRNAKKKQ